MLKFHNETARALRADGHQRIALMRTWQRVEVLGSPTTLGRTDDENVLFSVKNTDGDFGCVKGFDEEFLEAVDDPERLLVEFDGWREYEAHNIFPIYLGDYWAPRFRRLAENGVKRIGLRFNWNSGRLPVTERPWANWVNVSPSFASPRIRTPIPTRSCANSCAFTILPRLTRRPSTSIRARSTT